MPETNSYPKSRTPYPKSQEISTMKKLLIFIFALSLIGCASKKPWNKDALTNDCLNDFYKKNEAQKLFDQNKIPYLCDCVTDKLLANYKSMSESDKDKEGVMKIGRDCAIDVMSK